ncbi:MAG: metallophosphoesterase family protein [Flavobacteriales bacterium]
MKRIGLISDTHSYYEPKVEKYFSVCDEIWHAGDIGSLEVTDALKKIAPLRAVYGNIDNHQIRAEFPGSLRFMCEGVDVFITHIGGKPYAYPKVMREYLQVNPPKLYICGHSHILQIQMDKRLKMLFMNPGAAGKHGFHKIQTILRFDIDGSEIKNLEAIELAPRSLLQQ